MINLEVFQCHRYGSVLKMINLEEFECDVISYPDGQYGSVSA